MKKVKIFLYLFLLSFSGALLAFKDDLFQISRNIDIFVALYKQIDANYVDETQSNTLIKKGIDGMLASLDPYTEYVPESEIETYKLKYISTQYGGIGISTILKNGRLFVNDIIEGYPAHKSGLQAGDEILAVQGLSVKSKSRPELSQLIRGAKGTTLSLLLLRDKQQIQKTIVRDEVKQSNVSYFKLLDSQIGYIRLDKFLENSAQEVQSALREILKQQAKGLVLDLRNNGGGILQEAVKIVNLFVPKGTLVVSQQGRNTEKNLQYITSSEALAPKLPLVILVNPNSASASEIVAGTLQDLDRAAILGQQSFGKGLVQQTFNLPYNSLVKITVAKYFTASGRCVQALDYAHRAANGVVLNYNDSTRKVFKTRAGRTVFEGKGVSPDVAIAAQKLSPIMRNLIQKNLFFDFANDYKKTHHQVSLPSIFVLSDTDYQRFVSSLDPKEYQYTSKSESLLNDLEKELRSENREPGIKAEIELLRKQLSATKKRDFIHYKDEIKQALESQIISRYYFEKGRIEQSFQYDSELKEAQRLLKDKNKLSSILAGAGSYKTIGKEQLSQNQD
jgi:carboxyl-terminal processing protease